MSKSSLIFLTTSLNSFSVPSLGVKVGSLSINLSIMLVVSGMLLFTTTFCSTLFSLTQDLNPDQTIVFLSTCEFRIRTLYDSGAKDLWSKSNHLFPYKPFLLVFSKSNLNKSTQVHTFEIENFKYLFFA